MLIINHATMAEVAVSLVSAVRDKYCPDQSVKKEPELLHATGINQSALELKPGGCPVERRKSLVLDRSRVSSAGEGDKLKQLCPLVEEAHLSGNHLSHWEDIVTILQSFSKLVFLDLSRNPLSSDTFVSGSGPVCPHLKALVLNHTNIQWRAVEALIQLAPNLSELHLAHNSYSTVDMSPGLVCPSVKRLHIQDNSFSDWRELAKLSVVFVELHTLVASDNPLSTITAVGEGLFPKLITLSLNNTTLRDWESFEQLSHLSSLKELSVLRVPVCEGLEDKIRRFAVVARIPSLCKLNKSEVSFTERENAERWLLREFDRHPNPPAVYSQYLDKHGTLDQLVDVDLTPRKSVQLEFRFKDGRETVTREVSLKQTVADLRKWVARELVGLPNAKIRLLYVDSEGWGGVEVMQLEGKKLHSYKSMKDGDQIHVQVLLIR